MKVRSPVSRLFSAGASILLLSLFSFNPAFANPADKPCPKEQVKCIVNEDGDAICYCDDGTKRYVPDAKPAQQYDSPSNPPGSTSPKASFPEKPRDQSDIP